MLVVHCAKGEGPENCDRPICVFFQQSHWDHGSLGTCSSYYLIGSVIVGKLSLNFLFFYMRLWIILGSKLRSNLGKYNSHHPA